MWQLFPNPPKRGMACILEMGEIYGDCVHLNVFGKSIVLLNSFEAANELLNFRSALYSDRPRLVMAGDMIGFDRLLGLIPYSSVFRKLRRLVHKELGKPALRTYNSVQERDSRILMENLILRKGLDVDLIRHYSGSVILKVAYGYQTEPLNDPLVSLSKQVMKAFSLASQPGVWAVDLVPWLRFIPKWFPGAKFKRTAAQWKIMLNTVIETPFQWAETHQESHSLSKPNFLSSAFADVDGPLTGEKRDLLLCASGSLFGGGVDTTSATISWFFLAMALHPDIQLHGQQEIDRVVGRQRLPELCDRPSLPYLECILLEVLRWNPAGPLSLPHQVTQNDYYRGFCIPKGTIVIPNVWSMVHDPHLYPDPYQFRPERFLNNKAAADRIQVVFGFGRRACPGVNLAKPTVFAAIATALATCEIGPPVGLDGHPLLADFSDLSGSINHPKPFRCSIKPRFEHHLSDIVS
ncbi:cytochrome P450 [Mycena sp. CBHHK59/15]|nr:cytochrome P450 [Mycena sp. CBHHK59/15]